MCDATRLPPVAEGGGTEGVERDLRRLERRHDDLVRVISHDLRSPLTAVLMQGELLRRQSGDAGTVERRAAAIIASATRLNSMIQDLVDAERLECGKLQLGCQAVDLHSFVPELLLSLSATLTVERVESRIGAELPQVFADPRRLGRILVHLLDNALKFSPPECPVIVSAAPEGEQVAISVEDYGRGIPSSDLPAILESRPQSDGSSRSLGLHLTRSLVRAHGGVMSVSSRVGQGTVVTVVLPTAPRPVFRPRTAVTPADGLPLLIVDDDGDARRAMASALRQHGFDVAEACEGNDALAQARHRPPAAAILDLILPGLDGWCVLEAMRRDPLLRNVPVVVVSAQTAFDAGIAPPAVAAFLEKPLDVETLCETVQNVIATSTTVKS